MNKNSKVLALKYRPQNFDDLIGQEVVTQTIVNSIKANKIPNAYLFTGIRGVGKTTIARIIAKALNCTNGLENKCKIKCDNCDEITNSSHIDVLEMDAASKTGVDDVRDLIEFSRYGPSSAKYKIFIIDEVHMLSKQAFNALLKTLEEPPQYENGGGLKFIFATTEIKKIPITVVSRCQRFDLSRVKSGELFEFIKKIKDKEKGKISDDALKLIVKISEGSVRDALSLLDRALLSLDKDEELDLNSAQKIFGYFDKSQLINLFELILKGEEKKAIEIYRKIYEQGVEPKVFINDFLELVYYFKNINSLNMESTNFTLNDEEFSKIKKIANEVSIPQILYNVPGRTSVDMHPDTVLKLCEHDNIIGIKEASGDIDRSRELLDKCSDKISIFSGDDKTAMRDILQGFKGNISVTANICPREMHDVCRLASVGSKDEAEIINKKIEILHDDLFIESNPIPVKWALNKMNLIDKGIRLPLTWLDEKYQKILGKSLISAGIITKNDL